MGVTLEGAGVARVVHPPLVAAQLGAAQVAGHPVDPRYVAGESAPGDVGVGHKCDTSSHPNEGKQGQRWQEAHFVTGTELSLQLCFANT